MPIKIALTFLADFLPRMEADDLRYEKEMLRWQMQKELDRPDLSGVLFGRTIKDALGAQLAHIKLEDMHPNAADDTDLIAKHTEIYPNIADVSVPLLVVRYFKRFQH